MNWAHEAVEKLDEEIAIVQAIMMDLAMAIARRRCDWISTGVVGIDEVHRASNMILKAIDSSAEIIKFTKDSNA